MELARQGPAQEFAAQDGRLRIRGCFIGAGFRIHSAAPLSPVAGRTKDWNGKR